MDKFQYVPMVRREAVYIIQNRIVPSTQTEIRNTVKIKYVQIVKLEDAPVNQTRVVHKNNTSQW